MTYEQIQLQLRAVERAIAQLCATGDIEDARDAYLAVLSLGQLLIDADSDDRRVADTLEQTRSAMLELLQALGSYVSSAERQLAYALTGS